MFMGRLLFLAGCGFSVGFFLFPYVDKNVQALTAGITSMVALVCLVLAFMLHRRGIQSYAGMARVLSY